MRASRFDAPRHAWLLIAVAALLVVAGCGGGSSAVSTVGSGGGGGSGGGSAGPLEQQAFDLVNDYRAQNGVPTLAWADDVAAVARAHSQDMATRGYFSHTSPEGDGPGQRLTAAGILYWAWAENIAKVYNTGDPADRAVTGWINSPGHEANMLRTTVDESGMGVAIGADGYAYFTQVFIRRR